MPLIYKVLIDRSSPKDLIFSYSGNEDFQTGDYVVVPLRGNIAKGYVIEKEEGPTSEVKEITGRIFDLPVVLPYILELVHWFKIYYMCNLSQALATVIPPEIRGVKVLYRDNRLEIKHPKVRKKKKYKNYLDFIEISQCNMPIPDNFSRLLANIPIEKRISLYFKLIKKELEADRGSIVLFPEVEMLIDLEDRFKELFGEDLAVMHSRQTPAVRYGEWWRIRRGEAKVVLGTRSGVFVPMKDPGLIILDEEQSDSYKDESRPLYDARTVACKLQELTGCKIVFGSSTPTLETYKEAIEGKISLLSEDQLRDLSNIRLVNMKGKRGFFSRELISYCKATLSRKKQIIILVNRKGYFTIEICKKCGYIQRCPNCNTVLVYHKDEGLVCHYCGYKAERIEVCPQCNGKMESFGYGTERIEDITHKLFPKARISRLDADLSEKEIDEIWKKFTEGHIDILVGTQMIARGFRLPNVYLAGILVPDTSLNIPDFRSSEKIFNLIYSLAEQAKDDKHVIIQTLNPDYYPIKYAVRLDYKDFYQYEVRLRRTLGYPPYSRIIRIIVSGLEEEGVKTIISSLAQDIERKLGISYSGPARAPLYKMRGRFYWHILLKIKDLNLDILKVVKEIINSYNYKGIDIMVDVDPVSTV